MSKKVLVLTLGLLVMLTLGAFGGRMPPSPGRAYPENGFYKIIPPANEDIISQYLTTPAPKPFLPFTRDTAGFTYYDFQHNNSMRRQIANDYSGIIHFTWMDLVAPDTTQNRYVDYNAHYPGDGWLITGYGYNITPAEGRGGYSGLDIFADSREVIAYHMINNKWYTAISIERHYPGVGEFNHFDIPDSVAGKSERLIWPFVACAKNNTGDTAFIHITNFSKDKYAGYVRCFEKPSNRDTLICQSPGMPTVTIRRDTRLVPNKLPYLFPYGSKLPYEAAPVVTSPATGSHKVAIAWCDDIGGVFYKGEIYYAESNVNGSDWIASGNIPITQITLYEANDWKDLTFYTELATVYDYNDVFHIFWTTSSAASPPGEDVTLWHWSPGYIAPRKVTSKYVTANCGVWNLGIAKFTAGVEYMSGDPAYDYLYLLYTGFSDSDTSAGGFANGDLNIQASSNGGKTWWGPDTSITNTHTLNCTPGNCKSEHWSSLAERVDSLLHIQYIYDLDAGGVINSEGTATKNPVRYLRYPRPLIPLIPRKLFTPTQMVSPIRWATNGGTKEDIIEFSDIGTATLYVKITGPSWVNISPTNFSIPEGDSQLVNLTLNGAGFADTLLVDSLLIASNDSLVGGGEVYVDTEWVKINFVVSDSFYYAEYDTVNTGTGTGGINTTVSNVGNLGNEEEGNMMNYNEHDYLFDCSPVLVTNYPGYNLGASWLHDRADFLPESHLQIAQQPEFSTWGITIATSKFAPLVTRLSNPYQWFWWWWTIEQKDVFFKNERVIVKYINLYKNPPPPWWWAVSEPAPLPSVYFGLAADWDVPTEAYVRNSGGLVQDQPYKKYLIFLKCDSAGFTNHYAGINFYYAVKTDSVDTTIHETTYVPYAAHILTNETQMYPFNGYNDDSLYKYMTAPGFSTESDSSQDMNILITAIGLTDPAPTTQVTAKYSLVVSDVGLSGLYKPMCGNANRDDKVTVSDVVYLVNYLFKGGPKPFMYYANANGDNRITVADVMHLVRYLFMMGAKPICNYPIALP